MYFYYVPKPSNRGNIPVLQSIKFVADAHNAL